MSDDGSNCGIEESAFVISFDDDVDSPSDDNEDNACHVSDGQVWNKQKEIGDDEEVPGPKEHDRCNGRHGLKDVIGESFVTVLQCIFEITCMSRDFFKKTHCTVKQASKSDQKQINVKIKY